MKTDASAHHPRPAMPTVTSSPRRTCVLLLALIGLSGLASGADLPPSGTNSISGYVRFTNADAEILARLGPPGNEGMTSFSVFAYTDPPEVLQSVKTIFGADPLSEPYALTVAANDVPLTYNVYAYLAMDGNYEEYWTGAQAAAPLTSNSPPATVSLDECVALIELRFVDSAGQPVAASGGRARATDVTTAGVRARYASQPPGRSTNFLAVPSGVELEVAVEVDTGGDIYLNRITHRETFTATYACDEKLVVTITIPDAGTLGKITGNANMVGAIEFATEGYQELLGRPVIKAAGPAGNQRYAALPGEFPGPDATRSFELPNLVPSTPAKSWNVWAEMQFGAGHRFESFRSPGLGDGSMNPGAVVTAGSTTDLGDTFVMTPSKLVGTITLAGPPELGGNLSALRGMVRGSDFDANADGIPDGTGASGINGSYVVVNGTDELAPGASLTTAGGQAAASFAGAFNPATARFEGDYEAVLGTLNDQPGVWKFEGLNTVLYHPGTDGGPYVNQQLYVVESVPWQGVLASAGRATNDLRYGFAEVCLRIRSPLRFFYPRVINSYGGLTNLDFEGNFRSYAVTLGNASAPPYTADEATNEAIVTMYLPEGSYTLQPAFSTMDADGGVSEVQLPTMEISVRARERYCVEDCLRLVMTGPYCATNSGYLVWADAFSCGTTLTNLSLTTRSVDYGVWLGYSDIRIFEPIGIPRATLRTGHGLFPDYDYPGHPEYYSNIVWIAEARDTNGRIARREIYGSFPFAPPPADATNIVVLSDNGINAFVDLNYLKPAGGSLICFSNKVALIRNGTNTFPVGTTPVRCYTRSVCDISLFTFDVTVRPTNEDCALRIALTQLSPPEVTLTWDCPATLQSADSPDGPWRSVPGATSPHPVPASGPQQFFRLCLSGDCSGDLAGDCQPAGLLAHEPFDYPDATPLSGANGGTGFGGAWMPIIEGANYSIAVGTLALDSLCASGGRMRGVAGHTQAARPLAANFGVPGTTRYFSFLLRPEGVLNGGDLGGFHGLALQGGPGARSLFIGKPGGAGGGVLAPYVLEEVGGAGQVLSTVAPVINETVLLVVKAEFAAGNDTFTLYVNPTPGDPEPATGAVKSDLDVGEGDRLLIYSGGAFSIDELRVGASFESVTPRM